jgi:Uma2 family endonuclease
MSTATLTGGELDSRLESLPLPIETDEALYELVNGERVEMPPMSLLATRIATRLGTRLSRFVEIQRNGEVFVEGLFQLPLSEDRSRNRRPDIAFVSSERRPAEAPLDPDADAGDFVPDLAVEVTSPTDRAEDQRGKVLEYFRAGVRYVWVVYPKLRVVDVYEPTGMVRTFGPDSILTGDPVLPGFEVSLAELFSPIGTPRV